MKFVLHKDRVVPTRHGHTIDFKKGVLTHVPPECHDDVIAIGAVPETEFEPEPPKNSNEPTDPAERKAKLMAGFAVIVKINGRESFAANGAPKPAALFEQVGFHIEQRELTTLWLEYVQTRDQIAADALAEADAKAQAELDAEVAAAKLKADKAKK